MTDAPGPSSPSGTDPLWTALVDGPEGVAVLGRDGSVVRSNDAFADLHGFEDPGSVAGSDWADRYADPDRARAALATAREEGSWQGLLTGDRPVDAAAGTDAAGPPSPGEGPDRSVLAVTLTRGEDRRTVCLARDVTDSRRRADRLEWYETLLDNVSDAVYALDTEGRITYINEYVLEQYDIGYTREELLGEYVSVVLDPEDINRTLEVIRHLVDDPDRDSGKCEVGIHTADGETIPAELHVSLLPDGEGGIAGTVGVIRDISGRKRRKQGLSVLQRVLRHNVRNETSTILGYVDLLLERAPEEMRDELETIREAATDLGRASEKARHVQSALDRRRVVEPVDLVPVLDGKRDQYERRYPDADLRYDLPESARVRVGDAVDLVLDELVENAVEHNESDVPRVRITVEPPAPDRDDDEEAPSGESDGRRTATEADGGDGRGVVRVDDDGPGIPETERAVLEEGDEDPLYHGSGLGLWLVNWFVETHDGDLSFRESEWGGSSVRLVLPAAGPPDGD